MNSIRIAEVIHSDDADPFLADLFDASVRYKLPVDFDVESGAIVRFHVDNEGQAPLSVESVYAAGSAAAAVWRALSQRGLNPEFPADVQAETASILNKPDIEDQSLSDLTELPFITIDNVDSKDLDQAMHIANTESGGYLLHYALADASHYIVPGTSLFSQALKRGASYYVPGYSIPMLPRALSEGLISLNEGVLRRALVFKILFDERGSVIDTTVVQARIKSAAKLSYSGVEQYYQSLEHSELTNKPYTETIDALRSLGQLRIAESRQRNVVEYDRSGIEIEPAADGSEFFIHDSERLNVERYNEQISLVCNSEGARLLESAGIHSVVQAVYRVHDEPDEDRLKKFSRLLKGLIKQHDLSPDLWIWRWRDGRHGSKETLAAYLERLRDANVDKGLLSAVQRHALMLSPASRFSAQAGLHHSLKLYPYARFSSPMREIAGIYTHRELLQFLRMQAADGQIIENAGNDEVLRAQVIDAANRSKETQKALNKDVLKKAIDQLFEPELVKAEDQRTVWIGTIISLRSTRVYVRLQRPSIVVKVYLRELSKKTGIDYQLDKSAAYIIDKNTRQSVFILGQKLCLQVRDYAHDRERWWLSPQ